MNGPVGHPASSSTLPVWMTAPEIAERLRLNPKTILRLARAGIVPCLRAGTAVRFDPQQVEAALCQRGGGR